MINVAANCVACTTHNIASVPNTVMTTVPMLIAIASGARHVSVIPVRAGNGWVDELIRTNRYQLPVASQLERVLEAALSQSRRNSVVTADVWDWQIVRGHCTNCSQLRLQRLERMNRTQQCEPGLQFNNCPCVEQGQRDVPGTGAGE